MKTSTSIQNYTTSPSFRTMASPSQLVRQTAEVYHKQGRSTEVGGAMAGAVSGVGIGGLFGPGGVIVGAAVGATVGMFAGRRIHSGLNG